MARRNSRLIYLTGLTDFFHFALPYRFIIIHRSLFVALSFRTGYMAVWNVSYSSLFVFQLAARTGQTNRRTDGRDF